MKGITEINSKIIATQERWMDDPEGVLQEVAARMGPEIRRVMDSEVKDTEWTQDNTPDKMVHAKILVIDKYRLKELLQAEEDLTNLRIEINGMPMVPTLPVWMK